jgi:hypothetical protein
MQSFSEGGLEQPYRRKDTEGLSQGPFFLIRGMATGKYKDVRHLIVQQTVICIMRKM